MKNQEAVELFTRLSKNEKDIYNKVWAEYSALLKKGVIPEKIQIHKDCSVQLIKVLTHYFSLELQLPLLKNQMYTLIVGDSYE